MLKPGSNKLISLEICRFIAAFCVMVEHQISFLALEKIGEPHHMLAGFDLPPITPVLFFFVLSGFVMMTAHHQDFGQTRQFWRFVWLRLCRIYPLYWLSLPAFLYFLWPTFTRLYLYQTFTLSPLQHKFWELNPPAWSLRFELAFYFMFAIAMLPVIGRAWLVAWIILTGWIRYPNLLPFHFISALTGWHPVVWQPVLWHFFGFHEDYFFAGLFVGYAFIRWRSPNIVNWPLLILSIAGIGAVIKHTAWGFHYPSGHYAPFAAVPLATFIFALSALERNGALRIWDGWARLGMVSYPLYLFNSSVIYLMAVLFYYHTNLLHFFTPLSMFALLMVLTIPIAVAITFYIDRPMQRALRKVTFKSTARFAADLLESQAP